jgi:hypothetical protein
MLTLDMMCHETESSNEAGSALLLDIRPSHMDEVVKAKSAKSNQAAKVGFLRQR